MYPVMQAYDCVVLDVDIELGGNDQLFNMLAGRHLMQTMKNKEKIVITGKLLTTPDGTKMGKTAGNMIRMDDKPEEIFGKVMAFTDEMILDGFEILTFSTLDEIQEYRERLDSGENPMQLKKELAYIVTSEITSEEQAAKAKEYFETVFQKKDKDVDIPTKEIHQKEIALNDLLVEIDFAESKSQAKRLAEQGAVKIDGEKITQYNCPINLKTSQPLELRVGRKLCKITYKP